MTFNISYKIKLNDGNEMPIFGLGLYQISNQDIEPSIRSAIDNGYRLFDTASMYNNEEAIGDALEKIFKEGKIKRDDLFITTKCGYHEQGYENAIKALENSLKKLKLEYVDLYLIHWPGVKGLNPSDKENSKLRKETWNSLEKSKETGKCRSIGVSNYSIKHLQELLGHCRIKPTVNQVEFHPYLNQNTLLDYCNDNNICLEAHTPLIRAKKFNDETINLISSELNKSNAQILLRWGIQKNVIEIPKSINPERIKDNSKVFDFELSKDQMKKIDDISNKYQLRVGMNPDDVC